MFQWQRELQKTQELEMYLTLHLYGPQGRGRVFTKKMGWGNGGGGHFTIFLQIHNKKRRKKCHAGFSVAERKLI